MLVSDERPKPSCSEINRVAGESPETSRLRRAAGFVWLGITRFDLLAHKSQNEGKRRKGRDGKPLKKRGQPCHGNPSHLPADSEGTSHHIEQLCQNSMRFT